MAYSGEGFLIEGQIKSDPNKTVIPVAVDSQGQLIIAPNQPPIAVTGTIIANDGFAYRSDSYTSTGAGVIVDASSFVAESYSIEVKGTNFSATSWTALLEGSNDGINFTTLMTHTQAIGDGIALLSGANLYPMLYFRSKVTSLILGLAINIVVTIVGKG